MSGAIGVVLAVGLQQITANFVSGIILLLERSIKVGDLIELPNGILVHVKKMAARYTLVESIDGKKMVIPNADFITSKITNLTYINNKISITIAITISYDANIDKAKNLMIESVKQHLNLSNKDISCKVEDFRDAGARLNLTLLLISKKLKAMSW